ncbi:MAG TPA: aromatic ring-hydroxylating dioxygenase subunit alpha [Actinomycetes bacterium]|nr:aromatic ring-hydroxylating dioxygenase subunit alpha [Actinomycetes bacterium]
MIPTLPGSWYTDPAVLDAERHSLLSSSWRYVGAADAVAEPGSYLTTSVGGTPLVVARDRADGGGLRAHVNVCRHRAAEVVRGAGTASSFTCGYHGWSYRLDGSLESAVGTDVPDGLHLPPADVDTLGPLLFAAPTPQQERIADVLTPFTELGASVSGIDLGALRLHRSIEHTIAANWKVVVENFVECYHCPLVHATTLPGYGRRDYAVTVHDRIQTQHLDADRFSFAYLFPTTQISAYGNGRAVVAREVVPVDVGLTTTRLDYWFAPEVTASQADEWIDFFESVIAEDVPLCESVQRGLETRTFDHGYLHPEREKGLVRFHELVRASLEAAS